MPKLTSNRAAAAALGPKRAVAAAAGRAPQLEPASTARATPRCNSSAAASSLYCSNENCPSPALGDALLPSRGPHSLHLAIFCS